MILSRTSDAESSCTHGAKPASAVMVSMWTLSNAWLSALRTEGTAAEGTAEGTADTQQSIQVGELPARVPENREPIRDGRCGHGALRADRRDKRDMITRGVRGRTGQCLAMEAGEELGKRVAAGADTGEPTLAGASGGGLNLLDAAKGRHGTSGRNAARCRAKSRQRSAAGRGSVASRWEWHRVVRIPNLPRVPAAQFSRGASIRRPVTLALA